MPDLIELVIVAINQRIERIACSSELLFGKDCSPELMCFSSRAIR